MPQPTKPQLALYAAFAIAVLLIGARVLREGDGTEPPLADAGALDGGVAGAVAAGAGVVAGDGRATGDAAMAGVSDAADPAAVGTGTGGAAAGIAGAAGGAIVVDVKGAVRRPGVYRLPPGARALDAVRRAGGLTRRADRLGVNLAARITDGGEVVVPGRRRAGIVAAGASAGRGAAGGASAAAGADGAPLAIDINTATAEQLEQLDGVGPATAAKIIAYREQHGGFRSIDELDEVSGIGEARLAAIRAQLGL